MSSNPNIRDLLWALKEIRSGKLNLQNISFHQSQSTSSSYQETESSMSISISNNNDNAQYFRQLLTSLSAEKDSSHNLTNLAFHGVDWELTQLQCLSSLLDNNSSIKQLEFQRNMFGMEGLFELSEMLGRNTGIKVAIFSECQLESIGAKLLASALTRNETLEELQIWEDSIGTKGAEELSRMIEVNSTLKLLLVLDKNYITATPIISAVLARNRAMEVHIWSNDNGDRSSKVVEFIPETSTLRIYRLNPSGCQRVACALGYNTTVKTLDMTGIRLKSKWAKEFRGVLEQNKSLRHVILSRTGLQDKAVVYVAAGLFKNKYLESLQLDANWFGGTGIEHLLCPLSRFSIFQNQANTTLKSVTFGGKTKIGRNGLIAILRMLSLKSCGGVAGELVLQAILETLQVNPWIEEIDLCGTPLQIAGKTNGIYEKLGQNGSLVPEKDLLDDHLPMDMPACCRVFLWIRSELW